MGGVNRAAVLSGLLIAITVIAAGRVTFAHGTLAWSAPARARVVEWLPDGSPRAAGPADAAPARDMDPDKGTVLAPGELLLVPVDPGDRLELRGPVEAVGLGAGIAEIPDVITWLVLPAARRPAEMEVREVAVPMWSSARFVAVRGRQASPADSSRAADRTIKIRVAVREHVPMAWFRADENVARWLIGGSDGPPPPPAPEAAALMRWIVAARASLASVPEALGDDWLMAKWLEESLRLRPLVEPFFVRRTVSVQGGKESSEIPPLADASAWVVLGAQHSPSVSSEAKISASSSDVVRIVLSARGVGTARAIVREGDFVARVLSWDVASRVADASRWTAPRSVRVVFAAEPSKPITVQALEGEVAIAASAHKRRIDAIDWIPARLDRYARLAAIDGAKATGPGASVVKLMAAALREHRADAAQAAVLRALRPDVAAPLRALVLAQAVGWAASSDQARVAAERGFAASANAPAVARAPLRRTMLERLAAVHPDMLDPPARWLDVPTSQGHEDDLTAIAAYGAALRPAQDGARPVFAPAAERHAWSHGELPDAALRAREVWAREAPWKVLKIPEGSLVWSTAAVPVDGAGSGKMCRIFGPAGLRWTVLPEGKTSLVATLPVEATHARIVVRGESVEPALEQTLLVGGVPISVHTGAGLESVFALAPGSHVFERPSHAPALLARIPRQGQAPCETLREIRSWVRLSGSARFTVPGAGRETVARIVFHPSSRTGTPRRIRVLAGDQWVVGWVRGGATGAIEVPVPAGVEQLQVETDEEMLLRVSARLHPLPQEPPRWLTTAAPGSEPLDVLLARVRHATRRLRAASEALRPPIRLLRGRTLETLGTPYLASFDLDLGKDAAALGEATMDDLSVPEPEEAQAELSKPNRALILPLGSPKVVPLGFASRVPPLPLPEHLAPLARARVQVAAGDWAGATASLATSSARESSGADALLFAQLTERAGALWLASEALARIGLRHRSGVALARAASLLADLSAEEGSPERAHASFIMAELAREAGDPASSVFARLSRAIAWHHVVRADATAGTGLVESIGTLAEQTLGTKARRALVDAPDEALLLAEGQHLEMRLRQREPSRLLLDSLCHVLGPGAECTFEVHLDGAQVPCNGQPGAVASCVVPIPAGAHRVAVRAPGDREAIGWVTPRDAGSGLPVPARVVSDWFEIDPERPLELDFAAPTVLRIEARVVAGDLKRLRWSITPEIVTTNVASRGTLEPDPLLDPTSRRIGGNPGAMISLGRELEQRIAVPDSGPHRLRIETPEGRALLRVQLTVAAGVPRPRSIVMALPPAGRVPDAVAEVPIRPAPPVLDDPDPGPGTAGVRVRYSDTVLGDEDKPVPATEVEAQAHLRRELVADRLWASARIFTRVREGPESGGVGVDLDATSDGWIPGGYANMLAVVQPFPYRTALGARANLGVLWSIPLAHRVSFVPWAGFTISAVDEGVNKSEEVDRDVFTPYAATHPRYGTVGLRILTRPTTDVLARLNLSARTTPEFDGLDRVDTDLGAQLLFFRGLFPRIGVTGGVSVRPITPQRTVSFFRTRASLEVEFWAWVVAGHRIAVGGDLTGFADVPNVTEAGRLSAGFFIGYDYRGRRGVRDLPPGERPFRARLEEDSGRIERQGPRSDPAWGEPK